MILFDLKCDKQHVFEAWFSDSAAYDKQVKAKIVSCPDCGSTRIGKAPMAPNLGKGTRKTGGVEIDKRAATGTALKALSELRRQVEKNFDNVGDKFPEEARKIHYGEAEDRNIYGDATRDEVAELLDDGIEVMPIPWVRRPDS